MTRRLVTYADDSTGYGRTTEDRMAARRGSDALLAALLRYFENRRRAA